MSQIMTSCLYLVFPRKLRVNLAVPTVVIKLVLRLHEITTSELVVRVPTLKLIASELVVRVNTSELVDRVPTSKLVAMVFSMLGSIFCFIFSFNKIP